MEDYYAYLETVGFKLAHLWGFQWADHFLPYVIPGYTPDTVFIAKYTAMVRKDTGLRV